MNTDGKVMAWFFDEYSKYKGFSPGVVTGKVSVSCCRGCLIATKHNPRTHDASDPGTQEQVLANYHTVTGTCYTTHIQHLASHFHLQTMSGNYMFRHNNLLSFTLKNICVLGSTWVSSVEVFFLCS